MRKLIMAAVALAATSANAYTKEAVKDAKDYYQFTVDSWNSGTVTRTDVEEAHKFYLDMQYYAKEITKAEYCTLAKEAQSIVVAAMVEEGRVGQRTTAEVVRTKRELYQLEATCH